MGTEDTIVEIETLESRLLSTDHDDDDDDEEEDDESQIIYTASFGEMEENFVKYQTAQWVLYSLLFILAWGIGVFMLLYLPLRRYILRSDFRSRKLFVTPNSIVYTVTRPVPFPCFGVLKKEKYVLLPSVADIVVEQVEGDVERVLEDAAVFEKVRACEGNKALCLCSQGCLESIFGVYSVRIENTGLRRPPSDDVHIQGITNPYAFRKAVLTHLANMKSDAFSREVSVVEAAPSLRASHPQAAGMSPLKSFKHDSVPPGELVLLQKLEEVGSSIKRVQTLIEEQHSQPSESVS